LEKEKKMGHVLTYLPKVETLRKWRDEKQIAFQGVVKRDWVPTSKFSGEAGACATSNTRTCASPPALAVACSHLPMQTMIIVAACHRARRMFAIGGKSGWTNVTKKGAYHGCQRHIVGPRSNRKICRKVVTEAVP
jgi:hypothetical protein